MSAPSSHGAARAPVNHCPYCGEETLRPVEEPSGGWACLSCLRLFAVAYHGMRRPSSVPTSTSTEVPS